MSTKDYFHTISRKVEPLKENSQVRVRKLNINFLLKMTTSTAIYLKQLRKKIRSTLTKSVAEDPKINMVVQCFKILAALQVSQS